MKNTLIDFSKTGGYRFKQETLSKIQETYLTYLKALIGFLGCHETGSYIISGCDIVGSNITSGYMYIDGEICPFEQTTGTNNTFIAKQATTTTLSFKSGIDEPVFRELKAVTVTSGGTKWIDFVKFNYVQDVNYVHTDNNFTNALLNKLDSIAAGAEVNVQADCNVTDPSSDAYIKNFPTILEVLKKGTLAIGDLSDGDYTVSFGQTLSTANYSVFLSFETTQSSAANSVVFWSIVHSKTTSNFKVRMQESGNVTQNITLNYLIIAN